MDESGKAQNKIINAYCKRVVRRQFLLSIEIDLKKYDQKFT